MFTKANLHTLVEAAESKELDVRLVLCQPHPSWTDAQKELYRVYINNNMPAWIIPLANPGDYMGLRVEVEYTMFYVEVTTYSYDEPRDVIRLLYKDIVCAQTRGIKRSGEPAVLTCRGQGKPEGGKLHKWIEKLTPIHDRKAPQFNWDTIEDNKVFESAD